MKSIQLFSKRNARLVILPIIVFVGWYIAQSHLKLISHIILPSPDAVLETGIRLTLSGELFRHITASLNRIFVGYALAIGIAIPLGILMGFKAFVEDVFDGIWNIIRPISAMAWIPLAVLWFGLGDLSCYFIVFYGCFTPILMNTLNGVKNVDETLVRAALTLGAKSGTILKEVRLPGAMPSILTGLRISLGVAWAMVIAAELIATTTGLGFIIQYYKTLLFTERVVLGMVTIGVLGFISDRIFLQVQKKLLPWVVGLKVRR